MPWVELGQIYECWVWDGQNLGPELISVIGNHEDGRGNDEVLALHWPMQDLSIPTIPSGIGAVFANLKGVELRFRIESVSADDFIQFPHLEVIHLERNRIASLDGNLFTHTPNIRFMTFDQNQLQVIGNELMDGLHQLRVARFLSNPCIDFAAFSEAQIPELKIRFENCAL